MKPYDAYLRLLTLKDGMVYLRLRGMVFQMDPNTAREFQSGVGKAIEFAFQANRMHRLVFRGKIVDEVSIKEKKPE